MSKKSLPYDDEIDLFDLFATLWDGRRKIIATIFVVALLGITLFFTLPNLYKVSSPLKSAENSVFIPFTALNELIESNFISLNELIESNKFTLLINNETIFSRFVAEFNDYEEIFEVVSKNEYVKQSIEGLDGIQKQKALIEFAKSFKLKPPRGKKETDWLLSFEWHDDLEGVRLFEEAIQQVLVNIRTSLKNDLNELAKRIDERNLYEVEVLKAKITVIKFNSILDDKARMLFLQEQSAIAEELKIESNNLTVSNLANSAQAGVSLSVNSQEIPYYLRGYKAIDKEIMVIESRSDIEGLMATENYLVTMGKIAELEADVSSSHLRRASKVIGSQSTNNWIKFDLRLVDSKSEKNLVLYAILSMALGGMIGVLYVLISEAIRKRKGKMSKA
ncbi:Wzz/FepE/Etk N-terminal domain-containing protein [Methylophilaceae bacterium]|nr:Wzz/FepE/Etk N-terminal domain-containing protein [Methylophilaceae bacterium]